MKKYFLTLMISLIFFACSKGPHFTPTPPPPPPPPDSTVAQSCRDFIVSDSMPFGKIDSFIFSGNKLIRHAVHLGYDSSADWRSIFTYEGDNMVKSYMYLGYNNTTVPYTTSEYTYSGNTLVSSKYFLGDIQLVHSEYAFDSAGNLTTYNQYTDNSTYQFDFSYKTTLHYDSNSNLMTVTYPRGDSVEFYDSYDHHPNPYFRLPFDFAYDVTHYFNNYFSKNNYQYLFDQFSGTNRYMYTYKYDSLSRLNRLDQFYSWDPPYDPPPAASIFTFRCKL